MQELEKEKQLTGELRLTIDQLNGDITHVTSVKSQLEIELSELTENFKLLQNKNKSSEVEFENIKFVIVTVIGVVV